MITLDRCPNCDAKYLDYGECPICKWRPNKPLKIKR